MCADKLLLKKKQRKEKNRKLRILYLSFLYCFKTGPFYNKPLKEYLGHQLNSGPFLLMGKLLPISTFVYVETIEKYVRVGLWPSF